MSNTPKRIEINNWLVAKLLMSREDAHLHLGNPHYIETDRFVDQNGLEDHWIFTNLDNLIIRMVYRAKNQTLEVFSDPPELEIVKREFVRLFSEKDFETVNPPELYPSFG